ncbi:MAG: hypothetical protein C4519_01200 [Desulfobacteraceae bacterium]|nr:MAG: hypothetical protein C4519_01200 [Desulfobacteraceae bacterium]
MKTVPTNRFFLLSAVVLMIGLNGCSAVWEPVRGRIESSRWSVQAPEGWMRFVAPTYEMLSKDGPYLQYIFIQERPVSAAFKYTQQHIEADMLPHELARVVIDNLQGDPQISGFTLLANSPAQIGGKAGFKLVYTHQDRQGLDMKTIYYGTVHSDRFLNLRYTAAQRHYFNVDMYTFEQVFKSLRLSVNS